MNRIKIHRYLHRDASITQRCVHGVSLLRQVRNGFFVLSGRDGAARKDQNRYQKRHDIVQ